MNARCKKDKAVKVQKVLDLTLDSDSENELELASACTASEKNVSKAKVKPNETLKKKDDLEGTRGIQSLTVSLEKLPSIVSPLKTYKVSKEEVNDGASTSLPIDVAPRVSKYKIKENSESGTEKAATGLKTDFRKIFEVDLLDQTADFSSGCTPFKSIAAKVVKKSKSKLGKKVKSKAQNSALGSKAARKGKVSPKKLGPPEIKVTENSRVSNEENARVEDRDEDRHDNIDNLRDSNSRACRICGLAIRQEESTQHLKECLQNKYQRSKGRVENKTTAGNCRDEQPKSYVFCLICQKDVSDFSVDDRNRHINQCMDGNAATATDEGDRVQELQRTEQQKEGEMKAKDGEEYSCQMCHRNLSHMNSQRRAQHMNRCIDEVAKTQKEEQKEAELLERARNHILDCPLCGMKLKTQSSRQNHLKKCASKYKISASILMQRVKEQEDEYKLQLEAGIVPEQVRQPARRGRPARVNSSTSTGQNRAGRANKLDEETQLALALSTSLQEQKQRDSLGEFNIQPPPTTSTEGQRSEGSEVRDAFSILMTPTKPNEKKSKKTKGIRYEAPPPLLMRSSQEKKSKLAEKVATVVLPHGSQDGVLNSTPQFKPSRVLGKYAKKQDGSGPGGDKLESEIQSTQPLWAKSCTDVENLKTKEAFYVSKLEPAIIPSSVVMGSKIKQMTLIPGWSDLGTAKPAAVAAVDREAMQAAPPAANESILVASTQTAVLLAGMITDETVADMTLNVTLDEQAHQSMSVRGQAEVKSHEKMDATFVEEPSGFVAPPDRSCQIIEHLVQDFENMVDNPTLSDLKVKVKGGQEVHAHKFVLAARCPGLLKAVGEGKEVILEKNSKPAIIALLKFLYAGVADISASLVFEVRTLSKRFQLQRLATICDDIIKNLDLSDKESSDTVHSPREVDKELQDLLKEAWGSDSELDSSLEEENGGGSAEEKADAQKMDDEIEELYEIMATQRQQKKKTKSASDDSDEEDLGAPNSKALSLEESFMIHGSAKRLQSLTDEDLLAKISDQGNGINPLSDVLVSTVDTDVLSFQSEVEADTESEAEVDKEAEGETVDSSLKRTESVCSVDNDSDRASCMSEEFPIPLVGTTPIAKKRGNDLHPSLRGARSPALSDNYENQADVISDDSMSDFGTLLEQNIKTVDHVLDSTISYQTPTTEKVTSCVTSANSVTPDLFASSPQPASPASPRSRALVSDEEHLNCIPLHKTEENLTKVDLTNDDSSGSELFPSPPDAVTKDGADSSTFASQILSSKHPKSNISWTLMSQLHSQSDVEVKSTWKPLSSQPLSIDLGLFDRLRESVKRKLSTSDEGDEDKLLKRQKLQSTTDLEADTKEDLEVVELNTETSGVAKKDGAGGGAEDGPELSLQISSSDSEELCEVDTLAPDPEVPDHGAVETNDVTEGAGPDECEQFDARFDDDADVWDGFDDGGDHLMGFEMPATQPKSSGGSGQASQPTGSRLLEGTPILNRQVAALRTPLRPQQCDSDGDLEYDPPTDIDTDTSYLQRDVDDVIGVDEENAPKQTMVTPRPLLEKRKKVEKEKKNKKPLSHWVPPSPFTPMAEYDKMVTPDLKKECQKVGVRALPKKRMILALKHIYHETHQYETDSEFDSSFQDPQTTSYSQPCRQKPDLLPSKPGRTAGTQKPHKANSTTTAAVTGNVARKTMKMKPVSQRRNTHDISSSEGEEAEFIDCDSQEDGSEVIDLPEESILISPSKDGVSSKVSKRDAATKKKEIWSYIQSNEELLLKILHYEPLEFEEFRQQLKEAGHNIGATIVMESLDAMNVCFTMRSKNKASGNPGRTRKGRKPKASRK